MTRANNTEAAELIELIDRYNSFFYDRDLEGLKGLYVSDGDVVFFDNHSSCDTNSLAEHLKLVEKFFRTGKIVKLEKENTRIYKTGNSACVTLLLRYSNKPNPGIRTTFVCELESGNWKIRHVHHSTDPNDT